MASIDDVQDLSPRVQFTAIAAQTVFAYPFPIFLQADLVVDVDGVLQVLTTDYTVSGAGNETGGNVTFLVAPGAGKIVTIFRDIAIARATDFQQNGPWSSTTFNDELDKIILILQELENKVGRAIRFPITSVSTNAQAEMAPISNFFGKFLRITSAGILEAAEVVSSVVALSAEVIGALLYPRTTAEIAAGVTPTAFRFVAGDVRRYGAVGDNSIDDTTAIQTALDVGPIHDDGLLLYKTTSKLTAPAAGPLIITGKLRLRPNGAFTCLDHAVTVTANTTLAADVRVASDSVDVVSASGMSVGDIITLTSDEIWPYNNVGGTLFKGETNRIVSIAGNTLTLAVPAFCAYDTGTESVAIEAIAPKEIYIKGLDIEYPVGTNAAAMSMRGADATFDNLRVKNAGAVGLSLVTAFNTIITASNFIDCFFTGLGYGIQTNASTMTTVTGSNFYRCRRGVDFSGVVPSHAGLVSGCIAVCHKDEGSGFGTHGTANLITFTGNKVFNGPIGFQIRSPLTTVVGNQGFGMGTFCHLSATGLHLVGNYMPRESSVATGVGSPNANGGFFLQIATVEGETNDLWLNRAPIVVRGNTATVRNDFILFGTGVTDLQDFTCEDNDVFLWNNSSGNPTSFMNAVSALTTTADSTKIRNNKIRDVNGTFEKFRNITVSIPQFGNGDATPSVLNHRTFLSGTTGVTITQFDDGSEGDELTIISKGATVYDTSTATRLVGSTVDITTADGDVTRWVCEVGGTASSVWRLVAFVDASVDNSAGA